MLLYFDDEAAMASRLAAEAGLTPVLIARHRFPDGELKLRLPPQLPERIVLLRGLQQPNEKLVELLLVAQAAALATVFSGFLRQIPPGGSRRTFFTGLARLFRVMVTVTVSSSVLRLTPAGMALVLKT